MDHIELLQFFKSGDLSDTIVRVKFTSEHEDYKDWNDKEIIIPVHSIVLASSSEKFKLLLTDPQWIKKQDDKYLIDIILDSPDQFNILNTVLAYCYTGSLVIPESVSSVSGSDLELRLFWTECAKLADEHRIEKVVIAALNRVFFANGNVDVVPWEAVTLALKEPIRCNFVKDSRIWNIVLYRVNKTDDKTDAALEMIVDVFGDLGLLEQKWRNVPVSNVDIIKDMSTDAFVALLNHPNVKASEDLVAIMVARKMLHQILPEDDTMKLLQLVRWEHVAPQIASHIKNHVEPVEKYLEKNMGKRQKLVKRELRAPSSVSEVVLAQYGDCRDNSEIVWSHNDGNCTDPLKKGSRVSEGVCISYFHGCRIYLRVKSDNKCLTASLVVSGLVWNTNINVGITATATAWIELFGDSRRWWSKQLGSNNEVSWSDDEVKPGHFVVKVAITGLK